MTTNQNTSARVTKFVGLEILTSATVATAVAVVLAEASGFNMVNMTYILASVLATVVSLTIAFFFGNGIAYLVGELESPSIKYQLTFSSVAAVVSVVILAATIKTLA